MKSRLAVFALLLMVATGLLAASAQDAPRPQIGYYIAGDAEGIQQVYQLPLDGIEPRQVTDAAEDVKTFGAAYDGLSIAYISGGKLWLQPLHTAAAEALADLSVEQFFSAPVYSPDGQYIAYADNGVWLLDLGTREARPLLEDVPVLPDGSNMGEMRLYRPVQFTLDASGAADKLILSVGVWEWGTAGVYDLSEDKLQILAEGTQLHTDLLPLADGRALLYGNTGVGGEFGLHLADSLDDINRYSQVLDFADLTDATLFATQAVEIEPGVVRVIGQSIRPSDVDPTVFSFDYDVNAGTAGEVRFIALPASSAGSTFEGQMSPDGMAAPIYTDAVFDEQGGVFGGLYLVNLETGEPLDLPPLVRAGAFGWQP